MLKTVKRPSELYGIRRSQRSCPFVSLEVYRMQDLRNMSRKGGRCKSSRLHSNAIYQPDTQRKNRILFCDFCDRGAHVLIGYQPIFIHWMCTTRLAYGLFTTSPRRISARPMALPLMPPTHRRPQRYGILQPEFHRGNHRPITLPPKTFHFQTQG